MLLDTGNILLVNDDEHYPLNRKVMMKAMDMLEYDALNLGINEIASKTDFLKQTSSSGLFPLISANVRSVDDSHCIQKYVIKEIDGIKIGITGILPLDHTEIIPPDPQLNILDPQLALVEILPELQKKSDFIILLSQFNGEETAVIANSLPGIDLAVCSDTTPYNLPSPETLKQKKQPAVLSIINKGIELGRVIIKKDQSGVSISEITRFTLSPEMRSDEEMLILLEEYSAEEKYAKKERLKEQKLKEQFDALQLTPEKFFEQVQQKEQPGA